MKAMLVRWHQQLTLTSYQNLQMASRHFLLLRNGSSVSHTVGFTWRPKHYIALFLLFTLRYKEFLQKKKFVIRLIRNLKRWAVIPPWMDRTLITLPSHYKLLLQSEPEAAPHAERFLGQQQFWSWSPARPRRIWTHLTSGTLSQAITKDQDNPVEQRISLQRYDDDKVHWAVVALLILLGRVRLYNSIHYFLLTRKSAVPEDNELQKHLAGSIRMN